MTWVLAAVTAAGAITSGVEANQTRQKAKGIIGNAYTLGRQRLNLKQGDTRESQAESLGARGLAQGGNVRDLGNVGPGAAPSVGGAHDLGGQAGLDEQREQVLEQTGLSQQKDQSLAGVNAIADQSEVNAGITAAGAVAGGIVNKPGPNLSGAPNASATPASLGLGGSDVPAVQPASTLSPYNSAWGGIDPINPTSRGAWAPSDANTSTGNFNKFGSYSSKNGEP